MGKKDNVPPRQMGLPCGDIGESLADSSCRRQETSRKAIRVTLLTGSVFSFFNDTSGCLPRRYKMREFVDRSLPNALVRMVGIQEHAGPCRFIIGEKPGNLPVEPP